jgi:Ca2+-binding EF-hand superfamily protein
MEMSEEREQSLREAFAEVDTDRSGSIDVQELGVLLKKQVY